MAAAAPLNWQQQELVSEGVKKQPQQQRGRAGRGRGRSGRGGGGGHAGEHQQPQQQWKQRNNTDDADAATAPQHGATQPPRQRRGRGGRNRADRDNVGGKDVLGEQQQHEQLHQPPKDQKDQLTWQQKMLLS
jgi:hypothetical protein